MAEWIDKTDDHPEFERVEPNQMLAMLWYYEDKDQWYLELTVTDEKGKLHAARYEAEEAMGVLEAKQWAEIYVIEALDQWPTPLADMKPL